MAILNEANRQAAENQEYVAKLTAGLTGRAVQTVVAGALRALRRRAS